MTDILLEARNITKEFPGIRVLNNLSFSLMRGEAHGLVGENGAGKSTLIKIISSAIKQDSGEIWFEGKQVNFNSPMESLKLGIGVIYQEFNLVPQLTVSENITLGLEPTKHWLINIKARNKIAYTALEQLGISIDIDKTVRELSIAQQQLVEISKSLARNLKLLIMDEPTASLNNIEIENLFRVINKLRNDGITILYISHHLREIFRICDCVTILKDGEVVGNRNINDVNETELIEMMVGRKLGNIYPEKDTITPNRYFTVENLSLKNRLHDINLNVCSGEILGVSGLEGQGQYELVRCITGIIRPDSITLKNNGRIIKINNPIDALRAGIAFIPEDRQQEGLILIRSLAENLALPSLWKRVRSIFINNSKEKIFIKNLITRYGIKVSNINTEIKNLSGGNQQKAVIAKWLGTNPELLIVSQPTQGIDVGSKREIHLLMRNLAREGMAIIMVSNELPEIIGMSNRVIVITGGRIVRELDGNDLTEEIIMTAATLTISSGEPVS